MTTIERHRLLKRSAKLFAQVASEQEDGTLAGELLTKLLTEHDMTLEMIHLYVRSFPKDHKFLLENWGRLEAKVRQAKPKQKKRTTPKAKQAKHTDPTKSPGPNYTWVTAHQRAGVEVCGYWRRKPAKKAAASFEPASAFKKAA